MEDPEKVESVTPCMYVYKAKIQSDGILDKLKLTIVVIWDLQNKEMIGDTCYPTSSISTLNHLLAYSSNHKERSHTFNFIGEFL